MVHGGGADGVYGGSDRDYLNGVSGEAGAAPDSIYCGEGYDTVDAGRNDYVAADCEHVKRYRQ